MRWFFSWMIALTLLTSEVFADRAADPVLLPSQATAKSDCIVIGKVIEIEKDPIEVEIDPKPMKISYTIAVIKIEDALLGARGLTQIRVGFNGLLRNPDAKSPQPNISRRYPLKQVVLTKDQQAVFFLKKSPNGDFFVPFPFIEPIDRNAKNLDAQIKTCRTTLKILEKPLEALGAPDAESREWAAMILLYKYCVQIYRLDPTPSKQVPIPADQNKRIAEILAEMEWSKFNTPTGLGLGTIWYALKPAQMGWKQPQIKGNEDINQVMTESIRSFLRENKDKFRVLMYVPETEKK